MAAADGWGLVAVVQRDERVGEEVAGVAAGGADDFAV